MLKSNLSINPRAVSGGAGWLGTNTTWQVTKGVAVPVNHPLNIANGGKVMYPTVLDQILAMRNSPEWDPVPNGLASGEATA